MGLLILGCLITSATHSEPSQPGTIVHFKHDEPVRLTLQYAGGIDHWDGGLSQTQDHLILSNALFISLVDENHNPVLPIADRVLSLWADSLHQDPFAVTLDLSRYYDLPTRGRFELRWGCTDVWEERIQIEIEP